MGLERRLGPVLATSGVAGTIQNQFNKTLIHYVKFEAPPITKFKILNYWRQNENLRVAYLLSYQLKNLLKNGKLVRYWLNYWC